VVKIMVEKLLDSYSEVFGYKANFTSKVGENAWLILYAIILVASVVGLVVAGLLFQNIYWMLSCIAVFLVFLYVTYHHQKEVYQKKYKGNKYGLHEERIEKFREMIGDLGVIKEKDLKNLDEVVTKEISFSTDNKRFPMTDIVRQLFVGLAITGLLAFSIQLLIRGNEQAGLLLIVLYVLAIGIIIMIGSYIHLFKDLGRISRLRQISLFISEVQLMISLEEPSKEPNPKTVSENQNNQKNENQNSVKTKRKKSRRKRR
jgi:hypothetical protein